MPGSTTGAGALGPATRTATLASFRLGNRVANVAAHASATAVIPAPTNKKFLFIVALKGLYERAAGKLQTIKPSKPLLTFDV